MLKKKILEHKVALIIAACIIVIIGNYFFYKAANLYFYDLNKEEAKNQKEFIENFNIKDTININVVEQNEEDYLAYDGIKVKNYFKDFRELKSAEEGEKEEFLKYGLYDENDEIKAILWMGVGDTYVDLLKSDFNAFKTEATIFRSMDKSKFLKANDINGDIELLEFLDKKENFKSNVFTSAEKIMEKYALAYFAYKGFPTLESVTLIKGDYTGYILNTDMGIKECSILKNGKRYFLTFINTGYFNDELIKEILNTVVID